MAHNPSREDPITANPALAFVSRPELRPLWRALHRRLGAGGTVRSVTVALDPGGATAEALANLLGWPHSPSGSSARVPLPDLEQALSNVRLPAASQLTEQLVGALPDRRAAREAANRERVELWQWLANHPTVREQGLQPWADQVRAGGVTGDTGSTRQLLSKALAVIAELPADAEPLAVLAGRVLGDPHALDDGRRAGLWVLRAIAVQAGVEVPRSAVGRRGLWERAGVRTDELSATILVAGRWQPGPGIISEVLQVGANHAQAVPVTLSMCRATEPPTPIGGVLHVVENPAVLAAAVARLDHFCPAVACTAGWPSAAGLHLLDHLLAKGFEVRYHGDLDPDGLRIADYLVTRLGVTPWRLSAADYLTAVASGQTRPPWSAPVQLDPGRIPALSWAPGLQDAMAEQRCVVYEEQVVEVLLDDLAAHGRAVLS